MPKVKKEHKFKKEEGEPSQNAQTPVMPPPAPPEETGPPPARPQEGAAPPPPSDEVHPEANKDGKPKGKKGQGKGQGAPCPEGLLPQEDGSCAPPQ
jgi:hypothetical protein